MRATPRRRPAERRASRTCHRARTTTAPAHGLRMCTRDTTPRREAYRLRRLCSRQNWLQQDLRGQLAAHSLTARLCTARLCTAHPCTAHPCTAHPCTAHPCILRPLRALTSARISEVTRAAWKPVHRGRSKWGTARGTSIISWVGSRCASTKLTTRVPTTRRASRTSCRPPSCPRESSRRSGSASWPVGRPAAGPSRPTAPLTHRQHHPPVCPHSKSTRGLRLV